MSPARSSIWGIKMQLSDIAAQMAAYNNANNNQDQAHWQQQLANRPGPLSFDDWQGGSFNGRELAGIDRSHYDNWAGKYYAADTAGRNALLANHGLQFPTWGWRAANNVGALPGAVNWRSALASRLPGEGGPGMPTGRGFQSSTLEGWNDRLGDYADRIGNTVDGIGTGPAEQEFADAPGYTDQDAGWF